MICTLSPYLPLLPPPQAYISSYTSHTKIDRLVFIAERSAGQPLELEALKIAADELKSVSLGRNEAGLCCLERPGSTCPCTPKAHTVRDEQQG